MTAQLRLVEAAEPDEDGLLPQPVHYFGESGTALTELQPQSLAAHRRRFGPRPRCASPAAASGLIDRLAEAALCGRGGAHFPTAVKWRTARSSDATQTVAANGAEGEPLSRKDTALLELRPHLVLDGLVCAAETIGAHRAVVWLHQDNHVARVAVARALAERQFHERELPIDIKVAPTGYLSGESSAVANAILGGPAVPTFRRPASASGAASHRAVLVQNVETLARAALLAYGGLGTTTSLLSVAVPTGIVVLEMSSASTVGDAVRAVLGGARTHAVLVGGYGGSWLPWHRASDMALHEPAWQVRGMSMGAGILHPLSSDRCGLARAAEIAAYLAGQSARQCGPCVFGLAAIADALQALADVGRNRRRRYRQVSDLAELVAIVTGRGACHHPDGAARMAATALETFAPDVQAHLRGGCRHSTYRSGRHG